MPPPTIAWFREDLRLADNPALTAAAARGAVIPLYILDEGLGGAGRWWLHYSLAALHRSLVERGTGLVLRRGDPSRILAELAAETGARAVMWNDAVAPATRAADAKMVTVLAAQGIEARIHPAAFLFEPESIRSRAGQPFSVFTPFWKACLTVEPDRPLPAPECFEPFTPLPTSDSLDAWDLLPTQPDWPVEFAQWWTPGEAGAHTRAQTFLDHHLASYGGDRDRPDREGTSRLSPHLHFGEVSARQIWHAVRRREIAGGCVAGAEAFLRETGWREFCRHMLAQRPNLPAAPLRPDFAGFPWRSDPSALRAWQQGLTGYPIVDAGMRQLWRSGWMHNRVRVIAASLLVKHLLIDWRAGAAWFRDTLVDHDLASNTANWQWVAGCGADAAPYFRIFSPVLQGQTFDPEGAYVRRWVPELAALPAEWIHRPWEAPARVLNRAEITLGRSYPHPIVDHAVGRARALAAFASLKEAA